MLENMTFELLIPYFLNYGILISFLVGLIFGVESIMILAFLGTNSALSYVVLFIFGLLGLVISDSFYFAIGKYKLLNKFSFNKKTSKKIHKALHFLTKRNLFFTMMYTKVAYGVSIAALIYFGLKDISWKRFLRANIIINIIGVSAAINLGWLAGNGYKSILIIFKRVEIAIAFIVLFAIILILLKHFLNYELKEKTKK